MPSVQVPTQPATAHTHTHTRVFLLIRGARARAHRKSFGSEQALKAHSDTKLHVKCKECGGRFRNEDMLRQHCKDKHLRDQRYKEEGITIVPCTQHTRRVLCALCVLCVCVCVGRWWCHADTSSGWCAQGMAKSSTRRRYRSTGRGPSSAARWRAAAARSCPPNSSRTTTAYPLPTVPSTHDTHTTQHAHETLTTRHAHAHAHAHGSQLASRVFAQSVKHYKCKECAKMFEKRTHMFRHYKAKHDPAVYQQGTWRPSVDKKKKEKLCASTDLSRAQVWWTD